MSDMPLQELINDNFSKSAVDIDDFYNHRIKGIYGEIIDFATIAQSNMSPDEIEKLYAIKLACRDIVDAVKDTKHLQKNLVKYNKNLNKHISEQYDDIRMGLAELLRNIDRISMMTEYDEVLMLLSKSKIHMQRFEIVSNGTLDNLIRKDLITNEMATSLMNDSSYAYEISKHLIAMTEVIFINSSDSEMSGFSEDMLMSDEDVSAIIQKG